MIYLGRDVASRRRLWGSDENSYLVLAPPRRGKGMGIIIPNLLDWPGPAVVPSTKDDNILHTAAHLARSRPVHVLDPLRLGAWTPTARWSPVEGCLDPQVAIYRARAFCVASGSSQGIQHADYFAAYNEAIHRCYLHAAAIVGCGISTVREWVNRAEIAEPARALARSPLAPEWSDDLRGIGALDSRTLSNVFSGARRVLDSLATPEVLRACSPTREHPGLQPDRLLEENGILYLVGTSGAQLSMAPIITALIESIVDAAKRRAAAAPGRRLHPPLGLILDEVANIAPLPSLPQLVADGGGQGITTMVVLQSLGQARARWGAAATGALWDASTAMVVLGGLADAADLEMVSRLCGEVDQVVRDRGHGPSLAPPSTRRVPVLPPAAVHTLRRWRGLLLYEHLRPIETSLPGWWALPQYRDRVRAALADHGRQRPAA